MITVKEATSIVLETIPDYGVESVSYTNCIGRTLAEDIRTDREMPPFDRVMMDGIAIKYESYEKGQRFFLKEGISGAGQSQMILDKLEYCIEIMTGAVLPLNSDTVIRYEDLDEKIDGFEILADITKGKNIHLAGSDHSIHEVVLNKGQIIKAIDVNALATFGKAYVSVYTRPKVAVISSGDELVEVDKTPLSHQIRMSNVHMLCSQLDNLGVKNQHFHMDDDKDNVVKRIADCLLEYDVILMSGGVSKGKYDCIPDALDQLGFEKLFHRVAQRPGKPFWFGKKDNKVVFAFPGNPVSTLACFYKYFIPWLDKVDHRLVKPSYVKIAEKVEFKPSLTYFAQAVVNNIKGELWATVVHGNGSGDLISPTKVDGFLELPSDQTIFEKGHVLPFLPFK